MIPQLFTANLVAGKPRLKASVFVPAVTGRVSLLLPPALLFLAPRSPAAALAVFFAIHTLFWVTDGLTTVGWLDLMGRLLTAPERARLIGTGMAASGVLGIGVGVAVTAVLGSPRLPFPASYSVLFAGAGPAYLLAVLSFPFVREPPHAGGEPPRAWPAYFRELAGVLRGDHDLRRVVVAQLVLGSCGLALPYHVLSGLDRLGFPSSAVGVFTGFQVAGGIAGGLGMGTARRAAREPLGDAAVGRADGGHPARRPRPGTPGRGAPVPLRGRLPRRRRARQLDHERVRLPGDGVRAAVAAGTLR